MYHDIELSSDKPKIWNALKYSVSSLCSFTAVFDFAQDINT